MFVTRFCPFLSEEKYISAVVATAERVNSIAITRIPMLVAPSFLMAVRPPYLVTTTGSANNQTASRMHDLASLRLQHHCESTVPTALASSQGRLSRLSDALAPQAHWRREREHRRPRPPSTRAAPQQHTESANRAKKGFTTRTDPAPLCDLRVLGATACPTCRDA